MALLNPAYPNLPDVRAESTGAAWPFKAHSGLCNPCEVTMFWMCGTRLRSPPVKGPMGPNPPKSTITL